jgi:PPOX class probable F420-dependent enzyme
MDTDILIPDDMVDLLTSDVVATVAACRRDGTIALYQMWVDYDGEHVMVSSAVGSQKARNWARDPNVTVSVVDRRDPWRFLVIRGRVIGTRPDAGLEHIDRQSQRYVGAPYRRRDVEREIFLIAPDDVQVRRGRG